MREFTVATHGTEVAVWEAGNGHPLLALHGLGLDHVGLSEQLEQQFDDDSAWRRIYLDLPGMGQTRGPEHLANADALLSLIAAVVASRVGDARFAILGQSYGGYLALGALQMFPGRVSGLALLIPVVEASRERRVLPEPIKLQRHDQAMSALPDEFLDEFRELIVDESPVLATTLMSSWIPSMGSSDEGFIGRLQTEAYSFADFDPTAGSFPGPSVVVCGRHDAVVGYEQAMRMLPQLDRGTLAVLDGAGHLVQLEKPGLTGALISDWLERVKHEETL